MSAADHLPEAGKMVPPEPVSMPQYWSVHVCVDGECIVSIGHDWLSGSRPLEQQDEKAIIGAAQHLLSFAGYGLPPCDFNPDEEAAPKPGAGWRPIAEAEDGVLMLFYDAHAIELQHSMFVDWMVQGQFCGNRHHKATHCRPLPPTPTQEQKA